MCAKLPGVMHVGDSGWNVTPVVVVVVIVVVVMEASQNALDAAPGGCASGEAPVELLTGRVVPAALRATTLTPLLDAPGVDGPRRLLEPVPGWFVPGGRSSTNLGAALLDVRRSNDESV